jgi:hypothetical protein
MEAHWQVGKTVVDSHAAPARHEPHWQHGATVRHRPSRSGGIRFYRATNRDSGSESHPAPVTEIGIGHGFLGYCIDSEFFFLSRRPQAGPGPALGPQPSARARLGRGRGGLPAPELSAKDSDSDRRLLGNASYKCHRHRDESWYRLSLCATTVTGPARAGSTLSGAQP